MLLFSDVLLLTRRHGKILSSIESPISLDNLLVQDINCTEGEPTSSVGSADSSEHLELSITSQSPLNHLFLQTFILLLPYTVCTATEFQIATTESVSWSNSADCD